MVVQLAFSESIPGQGESSLWWSVAYIKLVFSAVDINHNPSLLSLSSPSSLLPRSFPYAPLSSP